MDDDMFILSRAGPGGVAEDEAVTTAGAACPHPPDLAGGGTPDVSILPLGRAEISSDGSHQVSGCEQQRKDAAAGGTSTGGGRRSPDQPAVMLMTGFAARSGKMVRRRPPAGRCRGGGGRR